MLGFFIGLLVGVPAGALGLTLYLKRRKTMAQANETAAVAELAATLEAQTAVVPGILALISGLLSQIDAAANDLDDSGPILALTAGFRANTSALAEALIVNTPVADEPVPPVEEPAVEG